ncbi:SusC/RagA family TonB-linked outer membrane protein [Puia dinghuensis]|uniref:SusC/RagA family TonB-linked outer membrane protein n=1 Tax=Puia dinghuensis TaxID=1792502 RepID=A0A8J2XTZ3_9BACT|nr:TonB-dependent receptor [Puia dinghuensis]GGB21437.1 SusC/RagA family TonB-linked outer membrane protein [Puia dinghuensis]
MRDCFLSRLCSPIFTWTLFFLLLTGPVLAQNEAPSHPVKGKITDDAGQPIPGASVIVKGSRTAVTADANGEFSIMVHKKDVLIVSYVGFQDKEVNVGTTMTFNIGMVKGDKSMDDVVVIGYGSQKRRDVSAAVATMDTKSLQEKPITRIDQAMVGQMPGVVVRQQTGMPGSGFTLLVRGTGSISAGTEPLYVVDGFPLDVNSLNTAGGFSNGNPLNNLNPDDIESIQVLKDAAAGAIYGSRAANGVVLITTKRGQVGRTRLSINGNAGISQVARKLDVLKPGEWTQMATELENDKWVASGAGRTADQTIAQRQAILGLASNVYNTTYMPDPRWSMPGHPGIQYVNWQDAAFRTAPFQNYEVSASGGTETVRYFVSGGYMNQEGTLINTGYTNYSVRANLEATVAKRLKLGFNIAPTYSVINAPAAEGKDNQLMHLYNMIPVVEDSAGLNTGAGKNAVYGWATSNISPVAYLNNVIASNKTTRNLYTVYGELQIISGLTARSTFNYDQSSLDSKSYISDFVAGNVTDRLNSPGKDASGTYSGFTKQNYVNENTLNFVKTIHDDHTINAVAGVSYNYVHLETFKIATAGGFANDLVTTLSNAIPSPAGVTVTGTTTESNNTLFSYYGRLQYSYQGKYLLSGTVRRDGSSRFGKSSEYGNFPSLSAGWRVSQEKFMQPIDFINDLKLRFSWGKSGNNNIGDYSAIPTLITGAVGQTLYGNYSFGGSSNATAVTGQVPNGLPNPNLQWETSNTYDAGLDATIWHNRINIIFDVYQKKNTNLLLTIPIPAASGTTSQLQNIGAVQNRGLELGIGATIYRTHDFLWTANGNIAFNQNKVVSLGDLGDLINIPNAFGLGYPPFILQKGQPMYEYYAIKSVGILTPDDINNPKVAKLPKQVAGDEKFQDANGDGVIDANDRVHAGQPTPKYTWGVTNFFHYKAFDLSIQVYGQHGGAILSYIARAIDNPSNGLATTLGVWRNRFMDTRQNYNAPRGRIYSTYAIPYTTTDWIYSTDFLRIQNITLGYNLKSILKTGLFSNARVYASMLNWFGWDKYKGGVNPEAQNTNLTNGTYPLPGDYGAIPLSKSAILGVNVSF